MGMAVDKRKNATDIGRDNMAARLGCRLLDGGVVVVVLWHEDTPLHQIFISRAHEAV